MTPHLWSEGSKTYLQMLWKKNHLLFLLLTGSWIIDPRQQLPLSKTFLSCLIRCMCTQHLPGTSCARCKLGIRQGPSFPGASRLMRKGRDLQKGKIRRMIELWIIWTLENKPWLCTFLCLCFSFPVAKQSQD